MFAVVWLWRNDWLQLKTFLQPGHAPSGQNCVEYKHHHDNALSHPLKQSHRIRPPYKPGHRLHDPSRGRTWFGAIPCRGAGALGGYAPGRVGGRTSATASAGDEAAMKSNAAAEERQLVGIAQKYADTYTHAGRWQLQPEVAQIRVHNNLPSRH